MCGIFGAISQNNIYDKMKPALERLSYRGYDSAGIAAIVDGHFDFNKCVGHPEQLEDKELSSHVSVGHNRWATHGLPSVTNAHPHVSNDKKIVLVHNGIIENYLELKKFLKNLGFSFYSDTDTEVIPNLIQHFYDETKDLTKALNLVSKKLHGAYAIVFMHLDFPDNLFIVKVGSPICVGTSSSAVYVSSDINSLPLDTVKAVALDDERVIRISRDGSIKTTSLDGLDRGLKLKDIVVSDEQYELDGFGSFLEKEIHEQVVYSRNVMAGRVLPSMGKIKLAGISSDLEKILSADEIIFTGCGSAFLAAQIGAYAMETLARKRCRAIPAGELKYFNAVINHGTVMIAVSQSGETADTLGCIRAAKNHQALTLGIVNVPSSSIAREVSSGIHIRAGQEISVASTKAVTNQVITMVSLAALVASKRDLSQKAYLKIMEELHSVPGAIEGAIELSDKIKAIAEELFEKKSMLCIGRDILEPVAKEAALKIKEISYIHAEGYSASELKHGPLALIDKDMPTLAFASHGHLEEKLLSNIMEIKSRGGEIILVADDKCRDSLVDSADYALITPSFSSSVLSTIPGLVVGQLFALHLAEANKRNVDRPRNLAKSVTVE